MSASNATEYADSLAEHIWERAASEAPFGYVNNYDGSTADSLDKIDGYDPEEHDAENLPDNWAEADGYDYLRDVLDIEYTVSSQREYRSARICITLGGPTAWINTLTRQLEVSWWSEPVYRELPKSFIDALDEACEELSGMTA